MDLFCTILIVLRLSWTREQCNTKDALGVQEDKMLVSPELDQICNDQVLLICQVEWIAMWSCIARVFIVVTVIFREVLDVCNELQQMFFQSLYHVTQLTLLKIVNYVKLS